MYTASFGFSGAARGRQFCKGACQRKAAEAGDTELAHPLEDGLRPRRPRVRRRAPRRRRGAQGHRPARMPSRRRAGGKRGEFSIVDHAENLGGRLSRSAATARGLSNAGWWRAGAARCRAAAPGLSAASGARSASGLQAIVEYRKRRRQAAAAHLRGRRRSLLCHLREPRARQDTRVQRPVMRLRRVAHVALPQNARGACASSAAPSWAASHCPAPASAASCCNVFPWSASKHVREALEQRRQGAKAGTLKTPRRAPGRGGTAPSVRRASRCRGAARGRSCRAHEK